MADHVAVRVNGEWCELPGIDSIDHAAATTAVEIEHTRLGRVWVVPRSFPMRQFRSRRERTLEARSG